MKMGKEALRRGEEREGEGSRDGTGGEEPGRRGEESQGKPGGEGRRGSGRMRFPTLGILSV